MKNIKTYIGLSVLVIINVMAYNITKNNLPSLEPMVMSTISLFLATLVLWSLHFLRQKKIASDFKKLLKLSIGGLFGLAGFHVYLSLALEDMHLDVALLFMGGIPLMTLVAALLMGKKTRFRNIFWVFLAFFGVLLIYFPMTRSIIFMPRAIGAMLLANLCLVFYTLFNEKMSLKYDIIEILTIQVTTGSILLVSSCINKIEIRVYDLKELIHTLADLKMMGSILFLAVIVICLGYYLYNYALKQIGAIMAVLFINLFPVINLLYKLFMDDHQLKFTGVIGSLMILVSLYMIEDV